MPTVSEILEIAGECSRSHLSVARTVADTMAVAAEPTWHLEPAPRSVRRAPGRKALRAAAASVGVSLGDCVANEHGAASLPVGVLGSIAHTLGVSIAVVCTSPVIIGIGVDIEPIEPPRPQIAGRVLTTREQEELAGLNEEARWRSVLAIFCAKEASYKALDAHRVIPLTFRTLEIGLPHQEVSRVRILEPGDHPETRVMIAQDRELTTALAITFRSGVNTASLKMMAEFSSR